VLIAAAPCSYGFQQIWFYLLTKKDLPGFLSRQAFLTFDTLWGAIFRQFGHPLGDFLIKRIKKRRPDYFADRFLKRLEISGNLARHPLGGISK